MRSRSQQSAVLLAPAPNPSAPNAPLRVQIAEDLREKILSAQLRPGDSVTEWQIAGDLHVSRAPVREAIRILATEGLLEMVPYKGTTVRDLSYKDIEETYSLREQLEVFASRRIIERPTAPDLRALRQAYRVMKEAAADHDWAALNSADQDFHRALIREARHDLLLEMWNNVAMRVRQIIALTNRRNQDLMRVARNHAPILTALRRRDAERLVAYLNLHIHSAEELADVAVPQAPL